ncbi:benzoate para-hydroxylase [Collybia nuda]|uniref:Benzoate para-hydroxylase n=1 Tax=Collybia nuda TaxID=64659 RepID=A0A9P5Y8T3_9AGAR|nr:benzoate para-hydroxylase [Collybia nuda]
MSSQLKIPSHTKHHGKALFSPRRLIYNDTGARVNHVKGFHRVFSIGDAHHCVSVLLLVAALVLAIFKVWRSLRRDPLRDIPGPFFARWTPLWLAYHARRGRRYIAVDQLHKEYGTFVRISPNHISVAHKDAIPVIYGQGNNAFHKSQFYDAFVGDKASVFSTRDRQDHAQKRRIVSQAFSYRALQQCEVFIHDIMSGFVKQLDKICETGKEVDALLWLNYLAFDVLSDLAFGESINMVVNASDIVVVQNVDGSRTEEHAISLVDEREHLAAVVGLHPALRALSRFIPDPFFIRGRTSSYGLENMARLRVSKRISSGSQRDDILGKLIAARMREGKDMTPEEVDILTAETVTLLIAGSDTTSNSLTAIIHLIITHPRIYTKLVTILEESIGDNVPEYNQVKDIQYLDATIDEGLRHYATTAIGLHRSVPEQGTICCGKYFPPGTEMSVPAWTIQHDQSIWGDPETFRPERWLESKELHRYLLTFGKGPRACLGRNLAYMEMRLALATILLRYNIELNSDILETTEGFMHKPLKMMVKFSRRGSIDSPFD